MIKLSKLALCLFVSIAICSIGTNAKAADPENTLHMDLDIGSITIEMFPDLAPKHVQRIKTLTRQDFYNGIVFHRVISGFMAQAGDPTGTGMEGSHLPDLQNEFSDYPFSEGVIGMAKTQLPHSANSQFFICFDGCGHLTGSYTVWGKVTSGMDVVYNIRKGQTKIQKMSIAADTAE